VVVGSVLLAIVLSIFVGLYGTVIVFQKKSFQRGVSYVVANVAEFNEYTNEFLIFAEFKCFSSRSIQCIPTLLCYINFKSHVMYKYNYF